MPYLRPPITVHVPEEWDWADTSSRNYCTHRLADAIRTGLSEGYHITSDMRTNVYIDRVPVALPDRILISPGNPYRDAEAWHAVDAETYDGADDSRIRLHIGSGSTERQAALSLLAIIIEHTGAPRSIYDDTTCTALCAEIARRWP